MQGTYSLRSSAHVIVSPIRGALNEVTFALCVTPRISTVRANQERWQIGFPTEWSFASESRQECSRSSALAFHEGLELSRGRIPNKFLPVSNACSPLRLLDSDQQVPSHCWSGHCVWLSACPPAKLFKPATPRAWEWSSNPSKHPLGFSFIHSFMGMYLLRCGQVALISHMVLQFS